MATVDVIILIFKQSSEKLLSQLYCRRNASKTIISKVVLNENRTIVY